MCKGIAFFVVCYTLYHHIFVIFLLPDTNNIKKTGRGWLHAGCARILFRLGWSGPVGVRYDSSMSFLLYSDLLSAQYVALLHLDEVDTLCKAGGGHVCGCYSVLYEGAAGVVDPYLVDILEVEGTVLGAYA